MKITKITVLLAIVALFGAISYSRAEATVVGTASSSPSTDANQDGPSSVTATSSTNSAQDASSSITSSPSTDANQDGPASITSNPSTDTNQDGPAATTTATTTPPTNPVVPQSIVLLGGGGGSFASGGGSSASTTTAPVIAASSSCPLITTFMVLGGNNDAAEVSKLQAFLKNTEGANVDVNGTYDQKTVDAVKAFQDKYHSDILGPWGAALSSGRVYITTLKKINEISCSSPLTLSASELAIINAYKNRSANGTSTATVGENAGNNASSSTSTIPEVGTNGTGNENTAAAANSSVFQRFWSFIKNIF